MYIDDIVVYTIDLESHYKLLEEVLTRLQKTGLYINIKKSRFLCSSIVYLGYEVGGGVLKIDESRRSTLLKLARPADRKGVRRFLGAVGYFRKFVPKFAKLAAPLYELLHQNYEWQWSGRCEEAFVTLKAMLGETPIFLALADRSQPYILDTDASTSAIAGVLMQGGPNGEQAVAYASRTLTETERNWPIRELEAYAIVISLVASLMLGYLVFVLCELHNFSGVQSIDLKEIERRKRRCQVSSLIKRLKPEADSKLRTCRPKD